MTRDQRGELVREWNFVVNIASAIITAMAVYFLQDLSKTTRQVADEFREFRGSISTRVDYMSRDVEDLRKNVGEIKREQDARTPYVFPNGKHP